MFVDACAVPPLLLEQILPGAFEVQPDATFRPDLARAEIVAKQPFTLLYRIRPEARWSDGVPVSAQDFVFTWKTLRKHQPDDDESEHVRSVRALDRKTVRVVLRARFVDWRLLFDTILPRHALAGESFESLWKDAIDNPKTRRAIGSGPFLLGAWERGKQLTFVRNPRYWGPHPAYLDRIVVRFFPPEDTADALRRGEIDMIDPGPAVLQAQALELHRQPARGIKVLSTLGNSLEHFEIRLGPGGHPALKSRLVRQALAYGINRVAIARAVGELTLASPAVRKPLDSVVFLANSPYYRPNWRSYRYRPDRARRLLEQAGCRRGTDGIYVCAGDRLSLRFAAPAGVERRELSVRLAQAQLRRVGVEVVPVFASPSILFSQILPSGDFDFIIFGWILGAITRGPAEIFGCQQPSNFTGYCDRLVTRDLVQATQILDDSRRVGLLNKIDARLANAVPAIPLYQGTGLFAFKKTVRGVVPNGAGFEAWNSEDWWLAE
ncbi:MAG: ABC transporter family substrate-binding protein [Actinobacteria bacterium]|nr:ABC transporter family substrate-binding protein [Actinomycetota bacterium]